MWCGDKIIAKRQNENVTVDTMFSVTQIPWAQKMFLIVIVVENIKLQIIVPIHFLNYIEGKKNWKLYEL